MFYSKINVFNIYGLQCSPDHLAGFKGQLCVTTEYREEGREEPGEGAEGKGKWGEKGQG